MVVGGAVSTGCAGVPDIRIGQGFPQELAPPNLQPTSFLTPAAQVRTNAPSVTVISPNLKLPTVTNGISPSSTSSPGDFLISLGYVGNRGTRLFNILRRESDRRRPILPSFLAMQQNGGADARRAAVAAQPVLRQRLCRIVAAKGIVNAAFVNTSTTATDIAQNAAGNLALRIENTTLAAHLRPNQQFATIAYLDNSADFLLSQSSIRDA